jgi:hypothetical protein
VSLVNATGFLKGMRRESRKNRAKLKGVRQFWASLAPARHRAGADAGTAAAGSR